MTTTDGRQGVGGGESIISLSAHATLWQKSNSGEASSPPTGLAHPHATYQSQLCHAAQVRLMGTLLSAATGKIWSQLSTAAVSEQGQLYKIF